MVDHRHLLYSGYRIIITWLLIPTMQIRACEYNLVIFRYFIFPIDNERSGESQPIYGNFLDEWIL